jgi:hypothetical protein
MSEPARRLDADESAPELDAEDALHGVVNQLIVNGQRMSVIIPGSVMAMMPVLAELLRKAEAAGYLHALLPVTMPWVSVLPEAELAAFATALADAAASGVHAPERLGACLREWQATAEVYADPGEAGRLRQALREAGERKVTPWEYDETSA